MQPDVGYILKFREVVERDRASLAALQANQTGQQQRAQARSIFYPPSAPFRNVNTYVGGKSRSENTSHLQDPPYLRQFIFSLLTSFI